MPDLAPFKATNPIAINHIGVGVDDLDRAIEWYCTVLGSVLLKGPFEVRSTSPYDGPMAVDVLGPSFRHMRQAHLLSVNGIGIELFQLLDPPHVRRSPSIQFWTNGFFHICITDSDVEGIVARITQTGGQQLSKIWRIHPDDPLYLMCYCEDPFGNVIEIYSHTYEQMYGVRAPSPAPPSV
ncbi:MAG: VOC family protein [Verrucomicrobia bacterium]|nr:VOC family protein [Verrucomicrobiota bacterium]